MWAARSSRASAIAGACRCRPTGSFAAPLALPTGSFFYSQLLTRDGSGAVVASNPFVNLFTQ